MQFLSRLICGTVIVFLLIDMIAPNMSFTINKQKIQKEMKRYIRKDLNSDDIEILTIPKSEIENQKVFQWIHSMEFRYRGAMYDLIPGHETIETKDNYIFTVVNDVMEEQLLAEFISSFDGNPFSGLLKTIKHFAFDAIKYLVKFEITIPYYFLKIQFGTENTILNYPQVEYPPPKCC